MYHNQSIKLAVEPLPPSALPPSLVGVSVGVEFVVQLVECNPSFATIATTFQIFRQDFQNLRYLQRINNGILRVASATECEYSPSNLLLLQHTIDNIRH